jgi:hypothetical protein
MAKKKSMSEATMLQLLTGRRVPSTGRDIYGGPVTTKGPVTKKAAKAEKKEKSTKKSKPAGGMPVGGMPAFAISPALMAKIKLHGLLLSDKPGRFVSRWGEYKQAGTSNRSVDMARKAKRPGWRISDEGNLYFENRRNRSDKKPGTL